MQRVHLLGGPNDALPDPSSALRSPNGLLAAGGELSPERLLEAYRKGIFPWYEDPQPVLWWSPDPRMVLFPGQLHISRSLRKALRRSDFRITADTCFNRVIDACAGPRRYTNDTWIGADMRRAYETLHRMGHVHSIEVWREGALVGGLYGVSIGKVFFGESMFSLVADASKLALVHLVGQLRRWGYALIDCQQDTPHMRSMGADIIARDEFMDILDRHCDVPGRVGHWTLDWNYTD